MAVDWSIGQPRVDIGQQFQAGFEHGRQNQQYMARENALRGIAANPNDQGAANALLAADPATALQLRDQHMQEQQFQHQQALAAVAQHRDRINAAGEIMSQHPVTDQAGYSQVIGALRQAGFDTSDIPPNFDPNYVAQIQQLYSAFQRQQPGYTVGQGDTRFRGDGSVEALGQPRPPRYYPVAPGGTLQLDPSYQGPGAPVPGAPGAAPQPPAVGEIQQGYRFRGGNPADRNAWEPVQGGAGQPQAQGTFPRQDGGSFDFRANPAGR